MTQVSTDYVNDARSSIVDAQSTMVVGDKMVKARHHHHHHHSSSSSSSSKVHHRNSSSRIARAHSLCGSQIYAWYDNEAGYSMRTAELARIVAKRWLGA